jgi:hypothetical protein
MEIKKVKKKPELHPIFANIFATIPATSMTGKALLSQNDSGKVIEKLTK